MAQTTFMLHWTALQEKKKKESFISFTNIHSPEEGAGYMEPVGRKLYFLGFKRPEKSLRMSWQKADRFHCTGLRRILRSPWIEEDGYHVTNLMPRVTSRFLEVMVDDDAIY